MIRTAISPVLASFILFTAWAVNVVSYHPAAGLDPLTAAQHELCEVAVFPQSRLCLKRPLATGSISFFETR